MTLNLKLRRINHWENHWSHDQDNSWPTYHRLCQSPWQPRVGPSNSWVGRHRPAQLSRSPPWDSRSRCRRRLSADTGRETHRVKIWKRNRGESWGVHHRVLCWLVSNNKYEIWTRKGWCPKTGLRAAQRLMSIYGYPHWTAATGTNKAKCKIFMCPSDSQWQDNHFEHRKSPKCPLQAQVMGFLNRVWQNRPKYLDGYSL